MIYNSEDIKISVILPVYNVGLWIGECIESLKRQKQEGLEFIFVDDCGTDDSMKIVEEWAAEDERVSIIRNKENSGSGPSRNAGIEAARGEYLSFIDPDDLISDDFYDLLYNRAKETGCDIVKGKLIDFEDGQTAEDRLSAETESDLNKRITNGIKNNRPLFMLFSCEHTTAIYRATLFSDRSVRYGTGRNDRDTTFLLKACLKAESMVTVEEPIYFYRKREYSSTCGHTVRRIMNELDSIKEANGYLRERYPEVDGSAYISRRWRGLVTDYYYTLKEKDAEVENLDELNREIKRTIHDTMGGDENRYGKAAEAEVFVKYGYIIPCMNRKKDIFFREGVKAWTDFLKSGHEVKGDEYCHAYAAAVRYSFKSCKSESIGTMIKALCFYNKNISQLDAESQKIIYNDLGKMIKRAAKTGIKKIRDRIRGGSLKHHG